MRSPRPFLAPLAVLVVALFSGGWFLQQGVSQEQNLYFQARLFDEVMDHVANRYVDPVDTEELFGSAIDGVLKSLGDPNTSFLDMKNWENLRIQTQGEYGGVGLEIVERDGWVTVVNPLPGTPGTRAGIRTGDAFFEIDGESAAGWTSDDAVEKLRGSPGTSVNVKMLRPGMPEPIPFSLTRAVIVVRSVPFATMVDDQVGYVPLQIVAETSTEEVRNAIDSLTAEGAERLILDLRGNPGGLLDQGIALTDLFLDPSKSVVETRGRTQDQNVVYSATRRQAYEDLPVVVLLDERSASASEIIAGALQDHDRAIVLGATSFGKGSVQTLFPLSGGNVLKLTTAKWYTPVGRSIQKPLEEQFALGENGALALNGQLVSRPDTAGRPHYRSTAGRDLLGGGGITPDVWVMLDTLSNAEQTAVRDLYAGGGAFNTTLFNWVARYTNESPNLAPGFRLSDAMVRDFVTALRDEGLEVDAGIVEGASRYIRYHLEREIALQLWGDAGQFHQIRRFDPQLLRAVELLKQADGPDGLLAAAGHPLPVVPEVGSRN